jgi:Shedu protein SduA, N-terminal
MTDDKITTESVAVGAQETDPIVLRRTDAVRLVFVPMIVDRTESPVRGYFVWQRKLKADEWEEITGEALNHLKAGEGFKLELRSGEVSLLLDGILARKKIYEEHGIIFGQRDYFADTDLPEVVRKILEEPDSSSRKPSRRWTRRSSSASGVPSTSRSSTPFSQSGMRERRSSRTMRVSGRICSSATRGCSPN